MGPIMRALALLAAAALAAAPVAAQAPGPRPAARTQMRVYDLGQRQTFNQRGSERFFRQHMLARFKRFNRGRDMERIGRGDDDRFDFRNAVFFQELLNRTGHKSP